MNHMKRKKKLIRSQTINIKPFYQGLLFLILCTITLFIIIGALTSLKSSLHLSSQALRNWTEEVDGSTFLFLFGLENRLFEEAIPKDQEKINWTSLLFETATNIRPDDARSFLGRELPGFSVFDSEILVAGEGTDFTTLPIESSPPLEAIAEDKETVVDNVEEEPEKPINEEDKPPLSTEGRDVVYVYSTHNRESFLPHIPDGKGPDDAFHSEVNITMVNDRFVKALEKYGIGAVADETDIYKRLVENDMAYWQSYDAARPVVQDALSKNRDIQYIFDFHRDAVGRDVTTKEINGKTYARLMFVVGGEVENFEKNKQYALQLHELLEKKYPGLSRGVIVKGGEGNNGVYNQDLSEKSIVVEFGGVYNDFNELYRTADAFAEVFSEFYWDAEKVDAQPAGS
jgi:stage II sporulation protein P